MSDNRVVKFPWDDGSGESFTISWDPSVSTADYSSLLSVSCPNPYTGSTSRSKVVTVSLDSDSSVSVTMNVVQRKAAKNTLAMLFREGSSGAWVPNITVNTDSGATKLYVSCSYTHTVYDVSGAGSDTVIAMTADNLGSEFRLSLGDAAATLLSVGSDAGGVFITVAKNTVAFVGDLVVNAAYSGSLGSASTEGTISIASGQFTVQSISLTAAFNSPSYGSSVSLPSAGGTVSLRYAATLLMADGSVESRQFELGSSDMGGTLSGSLVGGTLSYSDYARWGSVRVPANEEESVVSSTLTWSWEGKTSTVTVSQAAAVVIKEVGRYLTLIVSPTSYEIAGGTGTYSVSSFARMSDGSVKSLGDVTSTATVISTVSWLAVSGGKVTVGKNAQVGDPRVGVISASLAGYDGDSVSVSQESSQELGRDLVLTLTPSQFAWEGGSGTYTVRGVIRMVDGSTQDAGDLTSECTVTSSVSWLTLNNGTFTVSAFDMVADPRSAEVTVSLAGYTSDSGMVEQTGKTESPWGAWSLEVSPANYAAPASGGSATVTVKAVRSRADGSETDTRVATWSGSDGFTAVLTDFDGGGVSWSQGVVSVAENVGSASRTGSIVFGFEDASATFAVTQSAASTSWGSPSGGVLTVVDIPAGGGRVSEGVLSGTLKQSYVVNGVSAEKTFTFADVTGGSWSAAVTGDSLGTTITSRKKKGVLTYSYLLNGVAGSVSADVYQAANSLTWDDPVVSLSYGDIPAGGGSVSPSVSITQLGSYTSGSGASNSTIGSKVFSGSGVNTSNGSVSANSLGTTVKARTEITTSTVRVTANGKEGLASAAVYQEANKVTSTVYGVPVVSVTASDVPASGGSVMSGTVTYSQSRTQHYTSGDTSDLSPETSGGSVSWSGGASNIPSLGTTVKGRTAVGSPLVATVTMHDKSGSGSVTVYQAENKVESYGSWDDVFKLSHDVISNAADYVIYSGSSKRSVTYTSGVSGDEEYEIKTVSKPTGYSWVDIDTSASTVSVEANLGDEDRSVVLTCTFMNDRTATVRLTQQGLGLNILIRVDNQTGYQINWQAVGTLGANEGYLTAPYYSTYYTAPSYTTSAPSEGCGLFNPAGVGLTHISSMNLEHIVLYAFDEGGHVLSLRFTAWVEVLRHHSTGEDEILGTYGSVSTPMVSGTTNGVGVSATSVSGPTITVSDVSAYRICYYVTSN